MCVHVGTRARVHVLHDVRARIRAALPSQFHVPHVGLRLLFELELSVVAPITRCYRSAPDASFVKARNS